MATLNRRQSNGEESHDESLVRFSDVTETQELVQNVNGNGNMSDASFIIGRSIIREHPQSATPIRGTSSGTAGSSSSARSRRSIFRRMNTQVKSYYNKTERREQPQQEEDVGLSPRLTRIWFVLNVMLFVGLLWASYVWSLRDPDFGLRQTLIRAIIIYVFSFFISFAPVDSIDAWYERIDAVEEQLSKTQKAEKTESTAKILSMMLTQLVFIGVLTFFGVYIASSPCFSCARIYQHGGDMASEGTDLLLGQSTRSASLWKVILGPADGVDPGTEVCRACLSWLASIFLQRSRFTNEVDSPVGQSKPSGIVKSRHDLIRWYNEFFKTESKKYRDSSLQKVLEGLATDGVFDDDQLYDILNDLLCSPTSRIDSPDPAQFLSAIDRPRFTGEDVGGEGLDIPLDKLQAIMRGDMLRNLGPSVCFMLRFSLLIQEDDSSERFPISSVLDENSLLSQADMKAQDCSFDAPGVVIAGLDPDLDPKSSRIESIKSAISIFERLPFEDERYYFDTKEEYLAFFRWTLQSAVQSEWYLPTWLEHLAENEEGDTSIYTSFLSNPRVHSPDQSSLLDTLSDKTLADRVIYGTGQKFLSALKLPGDTDYFYYHPFGPDSYSTWNHTKFYRYNNKPKNEDLLQMAQSFWSDDLKIFGNNCDAAGSSRSMLNPLKKMWRRPTSNSPSGQCQTGAILQEMRSRIVQIDMSFFGSIDGRKGQFHNSGCILYLDTQSRMPMGIFKTNMTDDGRDIGTMYLPTDGRDWESAKYTYRTAERAVLASIHVKESHFGWSHALSVATLQTIPSDHKLHALLKPFTRGAHVVNSAAYHMLVRDHSILAHSSGQVDGQDAMLYVGHQMDFSETVPEMLEAKQLDVNLTKDMPFFSQGQRLWAVHYEFVSDFVTKILYDSDNAMRDDDSIHRFWHHVNTLGRGHDPCVCDMGASSFFKADVWPEFDSSSDSTRTCNELLDSASFMPDLTALSDRRREWCLQDDFTRIVALRNLLEEECKRHKKCKKLRHSFEHMRLNMGLKPLKTRDQLIEFLTSAIWHVSVGHSINGDNMAYLPDPTYAGVRQRGKDSNGELEVIADVGTYVFGITIGALTTVKNNALMADWTPIYSYLSEMQDDLTKEEKSDLFDSMDKLHRRYKMKLLTLSVDFLRESESRPKNQQSNVFNPMTHSASVCV